MPDISRTDQSNALPTRPLPGRDTPVLDMPFFHRVFGDRLDRHFEQGETIYLAMGCFWGAEKLFWSVQEMSGMVPPRGEVVSQVRNATDPSRWGPLPDVPAARSYD